MSKIYNSLFFESSNIDFQQFTFEEQQEVRKIIEEMQDQKKTRRGAELLFGLVILGGVAGVYIIVGKFNWLILFLVFGFIGMMAELFTPLERLIKAIGDTLGSILQITESSKEEASKNFRASEIRLNEILNRYGFESIDGEISKVSPDA